MTLYPPPGSSNPAAPSRGTNRHGTVRTRTGPRAALGDLEPLVAPRSDRDDEAAAGRELVVERLRHGRRRGGDDDPVERRALGHAERAVADADVDASVSRALERPPRLLREFRDALDRDHLVGELGEQRRLVAGACADLEHAPPVEPKRLEHRRRP